MTSSANELNETRNLFDAAALPAGRRRCGVGRRRRRRQVAALAAPLQRRYQRQFVDPRAGNVDVFTGFNHHRLVS